jgi:hypothetical protein
VFVSGADFCLPIQVVRNLKGGLHEVARCQISNRAASRSASDGGEPATFGFGGLRSTE